MRLSVLNGRVRLEHEPLRPVAALRVLLGKYDAQNRLGRFVVLERQQQFHRALADVTGAPRAAGILLKTVSHAEMHYRVVHQPGKNRVDRAGATIAVGARDADATGQVPPEAGRLRLDRRLIDAAAVAGCEVLGTLRIGHRPDHGKDEFVGGPGSHRRVGAAAAPAVGVQELVATYGVDALGCTRHQVIDGLRIASAPDFLRVRPETESLLRRIDLQLRGVLEFVLAEGQMAENQESARRACNRHAPLHRGLVAANHC